MNPGILRAGKEMLKSVRNRCEFLAQLGILLGTGGMVYLGSGLLRPSPTYAADGNPDVCFDGICGRKIYGGTLPHDRLAGYWEPIGGDKLPDYHYYPGMQSLALAPVRAVLTVRCRAFRC